MLALSRSVLLTGLLVSLLVTAGCSEPATSDYRDAPESIQDGSLDYEDYKEAGCPYLGDSLDHETMEKCNKWIRNQTTSNTTEK